MKTTILLLALVISGSSLAVAQNKSKLVLPQKPDLTKKVKIPHRVIPEKMIVPRHQGRIIETSWADRQVRIKKSSGETTFITIPSVVSIAGRDVNVHTNAAAFRRAFKLDEYIVAFENRRISADKIEAQDVVRLEGIWARATVQ